ncbi:alpha/beta hydrolase [Vulcaniibacterium tengchongense]|uniref:Putative alpha/beta superfamily hydrolase n=1 Tax=Vulcaniibacterium tengchongense TaxID=1273429 RepID=A0A3N4VJQ6_9GAMM|nr:alpha/beta hydrolase-fold protein [Vulcaniibacterium tengchongense]RPE81933.1 putative alpha/beta superfamily hydrolase [Vulcaniibacterium tengchongense]
MRLSFLLLLGLAAVLHAEAGERRHTAGPAVRAFVPPLRLPAFGHPRGLRVYLPPGYAASTRRYPVLYMFDGQNLFDEATGYAGEWGVDEAMDALAREGFPAIVVGIDHGGELRFHELVPYWNVRLLPNRGADFVDDLARSIKPFVDANYRTLPDRAQTAILGSSLGGLAADYAVRQYPEVFGKAGVFSPSYWVSEEPYARAGRTPLPPGTRVYLYMGGREGGDSVARVERMAALLRAHPGTAVEVRVAPDAEHNEAAWRAAFPAAVRWLFELPAAAQAAGAAR